MRQNVIIAYRGTNYELGQWPQGYGIWTAGANHSQPNEWWPGTPEGWSAAWYRFVAIEAPGTIVQLSPPAAGTAGQPVAQASEPTAQAGQPTAQASQPTAQASEPTAEAGQPAAEGSRPAGGPSLQPFILPAGQPHMAAGGQAYAAHAAQTGQSAEPHAAQQYAGRPYTGQGQSYAAPGQTASPWGQPYAAAQGQYGSQGLAASAAWRNPVAVGLLIFGLVCGVISLFPTYVGGSSLASDSVNLVPHIFYLVAWAGSALLIGLGGTRQRTGALLGLGVSVVTFGLFFADAGLPLAHGAHASGMGTGLVLGLIGWLGCAVGSGLAFGRWPFDWPRQVRGVQIGFAATLIAAGIGAAITFAPSWDHYVLVTPSVTQTLTEGNAFNNPGPVIVGDVAVMIAVVAVLVAAALWRPARLGWALAAGAIVPLIAQLISAIIQITQSPLTQLGISKAEASRASLTASASLTGWFWAYCAFVIALVLMCGWLAAGPVRTVAAAAPSSPFQAGPAAGWPGMPAAAGPAMTPAPGSGMTPAAGQSPAAAPPTHPATTTDPGQPQDGTAESGSS